MHFLSYCVAYCWIWNLEWHCYLLRKAIPLSVGKLPSQLWNCSSPYIRSIYWCHHPAVFYETLKITRSKQHNIKNGFNYFIRNDILFSLSSGQNHKFPKENTMGFGENVYSNTNSAGYSRRETRCNWMWQWECWSAVEQYKGMCLTLSDLVGKVEKRARKLWITQEMVSKMNERRKWKNVNTEEGRKNYRRLRNEKSHR